MRNPRAVFPKLYIAILLICTSPCSAATNSNQDWESEITLSNGEVSTFSLHIKIKGDNLTGRYCAIYRNGKKIDCSTSEESNIFGKTYKDKSITVNFNSFFGAKFGIATITNENDNLIWRIKKAPQGGEFYAPNSATLHLAKKTGSIVFYAASSNNAYLFDAPTENTISSNYLIKGDQVQLIDTSQLENGWCKVRYTAKSGKVFEKWMKTADLNLQ